MLKINRKVEYALMALKLMLEKEKGQLTSAREICQKFNTPFDTTAKVLQSMNGRKILESIQGVKGGYTLSSDLGGITYIDLLEIVEGKTISLGCGAKTNCDFSDKCNIKGPIGELNTKLIRYLETISIKDLLLSK